MLLMVLNYRHFKPKDAMFTVTDLSRSGLAPFSFTVHPGECVVVRGASGAGKTLLMRALSDLDPAQGEITLNGIARSAVSGPQWRRQVGYVPAEPGWWAESVAEHFTDLESARSLAGRLALPATVFERLVSQASTGERLRLGLVRALLLSPQVLLVDEPTAALDEASTRLVEQLIRHKMEQGLAVLWTTHDQAQARRMGTRCLVVEGGQVSQGMLP